MFGKAVSVDVLLGILTATLPASSRLASRSKLFGQIAETLEKRGEYEEGLLTGLEGWPGEMDRVYSAVEKLFEDIVHAGVAIGDVHIANGTWVCCIGTGTQVQLSCWTSRGIIG